MLSDLLLGLVDQAAHVFMCDAPTWGISGPRNVPRFWMPPDMIAIASGFHHEEPLPIALPLLCYDLENSAGSLSREQPGPNLGW